MIYNSSVIYIYCIFTPPSLKKFRGAYCFCFVCIFVSQSTCHTSPCLQSIEKNILTRALIFGKLIEA